MRRCQPSTVGGALAPNFRLFYSSHIVAAKAAPTENSAHWRARLLPSRKISAHLEVRPPRRKKLLGSQGCSLSKGSPSRNSSIRRG
ncbi:MAG: hypothetical protein ACK4I8_01260 [Armatimonadota bacterium]